jgi:predicted NACHT family NTPase
VALWSKHDLRKDGLERQRYSGLQKTEFLRLLSAFAISSYTAADYDMREAQIERHFKAAVQLSGVNCDEEGFLKDLTVSTSLAVYDGPYIRFCHRTFQEYFAAVFLCGVDDSFVEALIEEVSDRLETDNVLPLMLSMNAAKIEKHWALKDRARSKYDKEYQDR